MSDEDRTVFCRYHCTACDRHFTSLIAFDRHRRVGVDGDRHCYRPADVNKAQGKKVLGAQTKEGACRYTRNPDGPGLIPRLEPVTLWEAR